jgi:parvulin-like peptidyl-prolyl isomerase
MTAVGFGGLLTLAGCPSQDQGPTGEAVQTPPALPQTAAQPAAQPAPSDADEPVATIQGLTITMQELQAPLIQAFGLNMLLKVVQLELAKEQAARMGILLTPHDFAAETQRYLDEVFRDDKQIAAERDQLDTATQAGKTAQADQLRRSIEQEQQRLLAQLLDNQKLTRTEFDIAIQTTTYLRAVVQPAVQSKLTDDNLQESFRARYGEKVQVRHIACANLQEVAEAKRRLASGETFAQVAEDLSRNRESGALGGELPAFSRSTPGLPQNFKDVAFALQKPGDISDPVMADGAYHLIQLEDRIPPTAVKFEDVKDSVRQDLAEALTEAAVKDLRAQLGQEALRDLHIENPVLAKQFEDKITERDTQIRDRDQIRREYDTERHVAATAPAAATEPAREATAPPASTPPSTGP